MSKTNKTKTVKTKTAKTKTAKNESRATLINDATKAGVDSQIIASFECNDMTVKDFKAVIDKMSELPKTDTQKVNKTDKPKKEQVKNLLGGAIKKSRSKGSKNYGSFVIIFNLKNGDKLTQKLGVDLFESDSDNEVVFGKVSSIELTTKDHQKLDKLVGMPTRYHKIEHRLYFYPNGSYDSHDVLPEQVGYWLTSLDMIPSLDMIKSCSIEQIA